MFQKILIANRGEIACRVIKTARRLGIRTVAVFSDADAHALHVTMADEAVHIGGSAPSDSYLVMSKVIEAALQTGAEAIHPGYGFLSENAAFCELCADNNLVFIGPPVGAIKTMGSKSAAKTMMEGARVPLLPGYHGADQDQLKSAADAIGYPVLLKAVSGGGGKGMRQVHHARDFDEALAAAKREALSGFGDDDMLVEKYLQQPRHVEVQVFSDSHGNGVYLFERDCSVQRRHQKIIEEAPAPSMPAGVREAMGEAALRAARAVDYVGAGTVEFLLDVSGDFYFMEMNTRLQVEHPVTEMITGEDLVEWQLKVANGEPLPKSQADLEIRGHAFEARIYAEDPDNDFLPAAGTLAFLQQPLASAHVRVDTGVIQGDAVGVFYDPMIAKLIVWGEDRDIALRRLNAALRDYRIAGVTTNIEFLTLLSQNPAFAAAELSTDFIKRNRPALTVTTEDKLATLAPTIGLYLLLKQQCAAHPTRDPTSPWHAKDNWRINAASSFHLPIVVAGETHSITARAEGPGSYHLTFGENSWSVRGQLDGSELTISRDGHRSAAVVLEHEPCVTVFTQAATLTFERFTPDCGDAADHDADAGFAAPMNGTVVDILVAQGDTVAAGDTLVIMEAMKMEHAIRAPVDGTIGNIYYKQGDLVDGGAEILTFEAATPDP